MAAKFNSSIGWNDPVTVIIFDRSLTWSSDERPNLRNREKTNFCERHTPECVRAGKATGMF